MHRKSIASLILVISWLAVMPAFAADVGQYAADAGTKLGRGAVNAATGWAEIPKQSVMGSREDGVRGGIKGFFKGLGLGIARTLAGAFEIATFWAPVPERFEPVMRPATVFGDASSSITTGQEPSGAASSDRRATFSSLMDDDPARLEEPLLGEIPDRVSVSLPRTSDLAQETSLKDIFFASGSAALRHEDREVLLANARWLRLNPDMEVTIEGHCDDRGEPEYNQVLGYRRARIVRDFLVASGIPSDRISIVSYGDGRPFVFGSEETWQRWNRRVHFVVGPTLESRVSTLIRVEP